MKKLHLLALALCSSSSFATTFTVNDTRDLTDTNLNDNVCETEFKTCSLRAAIQTANKMDSESIIELPAGTYAFTLSQFGENESATGDLDIHNDITINGTGNPIIDAQQLDRHFDVHGSDKNTRLELNNISLINGKSFEEYGGSIKASSNITITNISLTNNTNDNDNIGFGGGIYISKNSSAEILDSTFSLNKANMGGAIFNEGHTFISGTNLSNNNSQLGGAIYNKSVLTINDSEIDENESRLGGAIFNEKFLNSSLNIFSKNTANLGGAVYNETSTEAFSFKDTILDNEANNGAAFFNIGKLEIYKSYGIDNIAESNGGFIINNGDATIIDSTIEANAADNGGAIYNQGTIGIVNSTLLQNTATVTGGLLHNEKGTTELSFTTAIDNSIYNTAPIFTAEGSFKAYGSLLIEAAGIALCESIGDDTTLNISEGYNTLSADSCNALLEDVIEETNTTITNTSNGKVAIPEITSSSIGFVDKCINVDATGSVRDITLCDAGAYETNSTTGNPGIISFELATIDAPENNASNNNNTIQIPVFRTDGSDGEVTVNYQTIGIDTSTINETDFTMTSGTLKWSHKDADTKYINIEINDDLKIEKDEKLAVVLTGSNLSKNYATVIVNIQDDDKMRGTFNFDSTEATITENEPKKILVKRTEYTQGEVDLDFEIIDTTNINPSDIITDVNSIAFSDGQTEASVEFTIKDDETYQPQRSFKIKLSDAENTVKLGDENTISLTVNEDELTPTYGEFYISAPTNVTEGTSNTINISRISEAGYIQGEVTFSLSTSNALIEIEETEITFVAGEESKDITFTVIDDELHNNETLSVEVTQTIKSYNGAETYAELPTAALPSTINIIDNDAAPEDGIYSFSVAELVFETEGLTKEVQIVRTGGSNGSDTILLEVITDTASEKDIELSNFAFTFEEGETEKTLSIKSVIDNDFEAATENLSIRLRTNDEGTAIGEANTLQLTLNDGVNEEDNTLSSKSGSTGIFMLLSVLSLGLFRRTKG